MTITPAATPSETTPPTFPLAPLVSTHAGPSARDTDVGRTRPSLQDAVNKQDEREQIVVKQERPQSPPSPGSPLQEIQQVSEAKPFVRLSPSPRPFTTLPLGPQTLTRTHTHTHIQRPPSFKSNGKEAPSTQRSQAKTGRKPRAAKASQVPGRFPATSKRGEKQCTNCSETDTPQWRGSLCNACALWKRSRGEDRPLPLLFPRRSPSPSLSPEPVLSPSPSSGQSRTSPFPSLLQDKAAAGEQVVRLAHPPAGVFWKRPENEMTRVSRHGPKTVSSVGELEGSIQRGDTVPIVEPQPTGLRALATAALQSQEGMATAGGAYVTPTSPLPDTRHGDPSLPGSSRLHVLSRPSVTIPELHESAYATPSGVDRSSRTESATDRPWAIGVADRLIKSVPRRAPRGAAAAGLLMTPASSSPAVSLPDVRPGDEAGENQEASSPPPPKKRARRSGESEIADKFRLIEEADAGGVAGWWDEEGESREDVMGRMGWLWDVLRSAERCVALEGIDE